MKITRPKRQILARIDGRAVVFPSILARDAAALTYAEFNVVRITATDLWAGDHLVPWRYYRKYVGYLPPRPIKLPVLPKPTDSTTLVVAIERAAEITGYSTRRLGVLVNQRKLPGAFKADDGMWRVPIKALLARKENPPPRPSHSYKSRYGVLWAPTQTNAGLVGDNDGSIAQELERRRR